MEDNGNVGLFKPTSSSNEDLSEYTDADESISAPTEFLAEFLSAVMLKDYETALKYCELILQYEPNNITAKEFYPLIQAKLKQIVAVNSEDDDIESDVDNNDISSASSDTSESDSCGSDDSSDDPEVEEEELGVEQEVQSDKRSKGSSDGDATTGSYSSLEDDEAEMDQLAALAAKYQIDNMDFGNGNSQIYTSSALKQPPASLPSVHLTTSFIGAHHTTATDNLLSAAVMMGANASDSESPTEPVSMQAITVLRAKVVPH